MNLHPYYIGLTYDAKQKDPAAVTLYPPYYEAEIIYSDLALVRWKDNRLDWLIRHELIHFPFWEYSVLAESGRATKQQLRAAEEKTVDFISKYQIWKK
jgi:hypothetical protein